MAIAEVYTDLIFMPQSILLRIWFDQIWSVNCINDCETYPVPGSSTDNSEQVGFSLGQMENLSNYPGAALHMALLNHINKYLLEDRVSYINREIQIIQSGEVQW